MFSFDKFFACVTMRQGVAEQIAHDLVTVECPVYAKVVAWRSLMRGLGTKPLCKLRKTVPAEFFTESLDCCVVSTEEAEV